MRWLQQTAIWLRRIDRALPVMTRLVPTAFTHIVRTIVVMGTHACLGRFIAIRTGCQISTKVLPQRPTKSNQERFCNV